MTGSKSNTPLIYNHINTTTHTVTNLLPDTVYTIKTAAYTNYGKGPYSSEYKGRSLKLSKNRDHPIFLWSTEDGLLRSDSTGENIKTLIHKTIMKNQYCKGISWYEDVLFIVTNTSKILHFNMTSHHYNILENIESANSIAVDWIGKKMYWSNAKQQSVSILIQKEMKKYFSKIIFYI